MVRLRDLTVNFNMPSNLISEIGVDTMNVYVKGTNIWTWTKDDDVEFDPEIPPSNGFNNIYTPITKTWAIGLNLTF
jgi:hypothetical protein